jgi:integrase
MKRHATQSERGKSTIHDARFQAVFDTRKRKVPGLWRSGSRYYAQLRVDLGNGRTAPRRIALDAKNLDEAKAALESKRTQRKDGKLPTVGYRPKFEDFAREYLDGSISAQKKLRTQRNERQAINRWTAHLGALRLDKITPAIIKSHREDRLASGRAARTVNVDLVALRNVLRFAVDRGHIERLPEVRQLRQQPARRRPLMTKEQFRALLTASTDATTKNAALFRFYIRFLALTGAREVETLAVHWKDVDFTREIVTIGSEGVSKNHRARDVNFSAELKALLLEMHASRPPDSSWLFPSPQRGVKDTPAKSLRESLRAVRERAALPWIGFHDLRHFFASECVMAGLDFMTIASWLGHRDGGVLVGRIYGHLADTHRRAAAQKLTFFTL